MPVVAAWWHKLQARACRSARRVRAMGRAVVLGIAGCGTAATPARVARRTPVRDAATAPAAIALVRLACVVAEGEAHAGVLVMKIDRDHPRSTLAQRGRTVQLLLSERPLRLVQGAPDSAIDFRFTSAGACASSPARPSASRFRRRGAAGLQPGTAGAGAQARCDRVRRRGQGQMGRPGSHP